MSANCVHAIEIAKNFGESCERTNLLINGVITGALCDCDEVLLRVNETDKFDTRLSASRRFKRLIRLRENQLNTIEIRYCRVKVSLEVLQCAFNHQQRVYDVQPLYLIPRGHDGCFQSTADDTNNNADAAVRKIDRLIDLAQLVIAAKLYEAFQGEERCFVAEKCKLWHAENLSVDMLSGMSQWAAYDAIADEIIKTFGADCVTRRKFIVFMSSTHFDGLSEGEAHSQANIAAKTRMDAALGGGFLCLMGSGSFYALPENMEQVNEFFIDKRTVDTTLMIDNSNYRRTYGGNFATFLGSLIHEIGHIFDLAHTETGLMGGDVDFVHRFFLAENLTEILPKRNVKSCSRDDNNTRVNRASQRITRIKKPGEFMTKYHEQRNNEMTFFEDNCLVTLQHHKWFTQNTNKSTIEFNAAERTIQSYGSPLTLVELRKRSDENSLLVRYWRFDCDDKVNKFTLPTDIISLSNLTIFAITRDGCVFKN